MSAPPAPRPSPGNVTAAVKLHNPRGFDLFAPRPSSRLAETAEVRRLYDLACYQLAHEESRQQEQRERDRRRGSSLRPSPLFGPSSGPSSAPSLTPSAIPPVTPLWWVLAALLAGFIPCAPAVGEFLGFLLGGCL